MYLFDFKQYFYFGFAVLCGAFSNPSMAQQSPFPARTVLATPTSPTTMPAFELANLNGGTLKSSDMKGKVIVIRFWATW